MQTFPKPAGGKGILPQLFLTFLKIGAVTFGGGYAMIALLESEIIDKQGWLSREEFLDMVAISESTPGPVAINSATYIGYRLGGVLGSAAATLGVVLPSFCIILLIAALLRDLLRYAGVEAFLRGIRPCVVAMILSTAFTMGLSTLLGLSLLGEPLLPDWRSIAVLLLLLAFRLLWKLRRSKAPSPMLMLLLSALLGMALFSL